MQGDEASVEGSHDDHVAGDRGAAIGGTTAEQHVVGLGMVVAPELLAGGRVEGEEPVVGGSHVHDPVVDQGIGLELSRDAGLEDPGGLQVRNRGRVEGGDGAVAQARIIAAEMEPFAVVAGGRSKRGGVHRRKLPARRLLGGPVSAGHLGFAGLRQGAPSEAANQRNAYENCKSSARHESSRGLGSRSRIIPGARRWQRLLVPMRRFAGRGIRDVGGFYPEPGS